MLRLKWLFVHPKLLLISLTFGLIIGGLKYEYELLIKRPSMSYMGVPKVQKSWHYLSHILRNKGYLVEYSERLGDPLWVTYKVTQTHQKYGKRSRFHSDWRSPFSITSKDYTGSHFDRGHLAPNYMIGSRYGRTAQKETFLMTNIVPQRPSLNRKIWQRLEEVSADYFSKWYPEFWVVTGPIFDAHPKRLKGSRVAIPIAFYKLFIRPTTLEGRPKVLAFIFPQTAKPTASLLNYVTTVDQVEAVTGIDFFSQLPDAIEHNIETESHPKDWKLSQVANLKSRY